jgi:hypothetical protein
MIQNRGGSRKVVGVTAMAPIRPISAPADIHADRNAVRQRTNWLYLRGGSKRVMGVIAMRSGPSSDQVHCRSCRICGRTDTNTAPNKLEPISKIKLAQKLFGHIALHSYGIYFKLWCSMLNRRCWQTALSANISIETHCWLLPLLLATAAAAVAATHQRMG